MKVEAIKHSDVRGKVLTYLKFKTAKEELLINVGEKTYHKIKEMNEQPDVEELPLDGVKEEEKPKGGGKK